jgi:adenylate cyclase
LSPTNAGGIHECPKLRELILQKVNVVTATEANGNETIVGVLDDREVLTRREEIGNLDHRANRSRSQSFVIRSVRLLSRGQQMTDATGQPKVERKLAAILAADVVGYSRLMGIDEEGTLARLKAHRRELIDPKIAEYHGRVVKLTGDGALVEFPSVVGAVRCAVDIQRDMINRNAIEPEDKRIVFRVGINLGDIIVDGDDIYGDGVNVATRLEALCEPGDICVSQVVHDQVRDKVDIEFEDVGNQQLKNIARPVRVYRVRLGPPSSEFRPALALPEKPSIAVLPFVNLSSDPQQEYFSDGITEDIITELSRFSELFVIARNSSFQYKGKSVDVRQIGRELGVRYVLEGSIRRGGDRVRITAQLVDALTAAHRWAERYDRELKDVFAVQDEVARAIVGIIASHVKKAEAERTLLKPPASWHAYDYYMRGTDVHAQFLSTYTPVEKLYETRRLLEQSLLIDPHYARAYAELSGTHVVAWLYSLDNDFLNPAALDRAYWLASKAVQLDPNLPQAHASLGNVLTMKHQYDAAIAAFERATALNPNYSHWRYAVPLVRSGNFVRAIEVLDAYIRTDPFYPSATIMLLGAAYYMLKRYREALPLLRECISRAPNMRGAHVWLAAAYAQLGQMEEARVEVAEVLRIEPNYTIDGTQKRLYGFKFPKNADHFFDGLRKAGLPER